MSTNTVQTMKRRKFLKLAGISLGASAAACCGLGGLAMIQPNVTITENHYQGEKNMNKRILVTYVSKAGSTGEVAGVIGQVLAASGAAVDVSPITAVTNLQDYQAVIVGSAVRMGSWIKAAAGFVETNKAFLSTIPVAYFSCGMGLYEDTEKTRAEALATMDAVRALVTPVTVGTFVGKMDYSKLSFFDRTVIKMVGTPEGDFRNWEAIKAWAGSLQLS